MNLERSDLTSGKIGNCHVTAFQQMTRNGIGIRTAQVRSERLTGQIHVYDGVGKGKSQAALGVVLRSIGLGINAPNNSNRVLLLRFLKRARTRL